MEKKVQTTTDTPSEEPIVQPTVVEAEEVEEDNFLDNIVEGEVDVKRTVRYLRNDGKFSTRTINQQRMTTWLDDKGRKRVLEIVILNRNSTVEGEEENLKAKQLGLMQNEKGLLYYQPNGEIKFRKVDINFSFEVQDYPHLLNIVFGGSDSLLAKKKRYNILCGQIVAVSNMDDFQRLWSMYGFLNEVDEKGNIIKENIYENQKKNPSKPTDKPMPSSFGITNDFPIADRNRVLLQKNEEIDEDGEVNI